MYCSSIGAPCRNDYDSYRWWHVQSILNGMGIPVHFYSPITAEQEAVLWFIRMPRLIIGLLCRWCLGPRWCGYAKAFSRIHWRTQVLWAYPQGIPRCSYRHCIGVTSLGMFYMPAFAFVGAFVSVGITIPLTWRNNKLDTTTLLLAGVAVSMLLRCFYIRYFDDD